jgi:hypothetical protein
MSIKEVFEAAKAAEKSAPASTKATTAKAEVINKDAGTTVDPKIAELEQKISASTQRAEKAETEYMRLMNDFTENTKATQRLIEQMEVSKTQPKSSYTLSDEEFNQLMVENPKKALEYFTAGVVQNVTKDSEAKNSKVIKDLYSQLHASQVSGVKLFLQSKYDIDDKEWDELTNFGEKYPQYTQNITDPKHAEAFYKFYKSYNGGSVKEKSSGPDVTNMLKKIQGFVDSGSFSQGDTTSLSPEEEAAASNMNISKEDYLAFKKPSMNYFEYLKMKKEKTNV